MRYMTLQRRLFLVIAGLVLVLTIFLTATSTVYFRSALLDHAEHDGEAIAQIIARNLELVDDVPDAAEAVIGEMMIGQARIAAHMVAIAEQIAGMDADAINARLLDIASSTAIAEFWITDETGSAYLRSEPDVEFVFSPDPVIQPQASAFWPLIENAVDEVIQPTQPRQIDEQRFKYAGVAGVDGSRIVQVGLNSAFVDELELALGPANLLSTIRDVEVINAVWLVDSMANLQAAVIQDETRDSALSSADMLRLEGTLETGDGSTYIDDGELFVLHSYGEGEASGAIMVAISLEDVRADIAAVLQFTLVFALVAVAIGLLAANIIAQWLVRPLNDLTTAAETMAKGEWEQALPVDRKDEIGTLAAAFSNMAGQLRGMVDSLEERVIQRTRDLQAATQTTYQLSADLQVAHEVATMPMGELGVDGYIEKVLTFLRQRLNLYAVILLVPGRDAQMLLLKTAVDSDDHVYRLQEVQSISVESTTSIAAMAARLRETVNVDDVSDSAMYLHVDLFPRTASETAVPMIVDGHLVGVLDVQTEVRRSFSEDTVRVLEIVAQQIALILNVASQSNIALEAQTQTQEVTLVSSLDTGENLRLPLYSMIHNFETMLDGVWGPVEGPQADALRDMLTNGDHLLAQINELVGVSRIELEGRRLFIEDVNLTRALRDAQRLGETLAAARDLTFAIDYPDDLPPVWADERRVRQILNRLVIGALDVTDEGTVTLQVAASADHITVVLEDGGRTLSDYDLEVLEASTQPRPVEGRSVNPVVLLRFTRDYITAQGGAFHVENLPEGGKRVTLTLLVSANHNA